MTTDEPSRSTGSEPRHDPVLVAEVVALLAPRADGLYVDGTLGLGGYLRLIAVVPGRERSGVGTALLAAFERTVAAESRHAFLLVSDFNAEAQRFYERHGYHRVGTLSRFVLPDADELLYWKRLT